MAIDFPDSPTTGDTYTTGGRTWQWDGTTWKSYGNYPDPTVLKIDPATNRVGINNTSPTVTLDVTGDVRVYDASTGGNASAGQFHASGSGANLMPSGTTAERPASPTAGMFRFNETTVSLSGIPVLLVLGLILGTLHHFKFHIL